MKKILLYTLILFFTPLICLSQFKNKQIDSISDSIGLGRNINSENVLNENIKKVHTLFTYQTKLNHQLFGSQSLFSEIHVLNDIIVSKRYIFSVADGVLIGLFLIDKLKDFGEKFTLKKGEFNRYVYTSENNGIYLALLDGYSEVGIYNLKHFDYNTND